MSEQSSMKSDVWSGRFSEPVDELVQRYTASVTFDKRLAEFDIQGSLAHAEMLCAQKILSEQDYADIQRGLAQIREEVRSGRFDWQIGLEDVHMNIERRLTDLIGDAGKRLHTGRSRNDQVATDIRLYLRAAIDDIDHLLRRMCHALIDLAERHYSTILPGFTHMQVAQPVTFGHHLLAYAEIDWDKLSAVWHELQNTRRDVVEQLEIEAKYKGYLQRQEADIRAFRKDEALKIPADLDYKKIGGLSNEVVIKLSKVRPETIGAASRVSGITPAAITAILGYIKSAK